VNDRRLHFGLGAETKADLEITWPDGKKQAFANLEGGRLVVIREGRGITRTDTFERQAAH
jgi:hypothetical protein